MKKRISVRVTAVGICVAFLISASACAVELYDRILVRMIGVDRQESGYTVWVHGAKPKAPEEEEVLCGNGETVSAALADISRQTGREPLYSHNAALVFCKKCAEEDLKSVLDFFLRYHESKPTVALFLSENTAGEILNFREGETLLTAERLMGLSSSERYTGQTVGETVLTFVNAVRGEGMDPVLPVIGIRENTLCLTGTAVFGGSVLRGVLTEEQTRGFLALCGRLQGGAETLLHPLYGNLGLWYTGSNCTVTPYQTPEGPHFTVALTVQADLLTAQSTFPLSAQVEDLLAERVMEEAKSVLQTALQQNGCDIFGFGHRYYCRFPQSYRPEQIREASFTLQVTANVNRINEENTPYL